MVFDTASHLDTSRYQTLPQLLETAITRFSNKPAYACLGKTHSFKEIDSLSRDFAAYLQHSGLQAGDRVAIQLPNLTQFVIAAYGVLRAGMVLVNTNPLYTERELIHQFNDSGAKALVVLSDLLPTLAKVVKTTPLELVISTHALDLVDPQPQPQTGLNNIPFLKALEIGRGQKLEPVVLSQDSLAALQYTGGTTGLSKGAMLSHGNLIANALQCKSRLGNKLVEGEEIFVAPLPIYHIYAFLVNLVLYFESGGCSVLIPNPRDIPGMIKTLSKYPFTGFAGLNTLFIGLCYQLDFQKLNFSHLKVTISGGTALTESASDLWRQITGCTISEGYGLSETSPVVSLNCPGKEVLGTIGMPVLGTEVKILDDNDQQVSPGQVGELAVRGPQVMSGYWQQPEETANVFTADDFFKTGDIALALENGMHRIVDRKKDMVNVSGFNVYPNEVENVLTAHTAVMECAVIGVPDERTGEALKAVIVLTQETPASDVVRESVTAHCRAQLTGYKVPRDIEFVAQLPKSTVGKILRRELRPA
ncbi:MAG: AMP-binding protein [Shewanella sp.]|nr:AMP-binding protein [Shewanella sp.]MCF1431288.1 AMP-binding protein [Shewanella sp.]MCF1457898.1 AMP-binding protein [Shewanella sp.]